jgi:hypothetical protein
MVADIDTSDMLDKGSLNLKIPLPGLDDDDGKGYSNQIKSLASLGIALRTI